MKRIQLYPLVSIFNKEYNETLVLGQYLFGVTKIVITSVCPKPYTVLFSPNRSDFFIKFNGKINFIENITFSFEFESNSYVEEFNDINLMFPFDDLTIPLNKQNSAVISTMSKNYSFRLKEWIDYNLKLGFSGIVIFDNDYNDKNMIHEGPFCQKFKELYPQLRSTKDVCSEYKDKVHIIDFPYKPFDAPREHKDFYQMGHWTVIQRASLSLGVMGMKTKCKHIALIDADEFIYMPKNPLESIETFLYNKSSLRIENRFLTNKGKDFIDNNVLEKARFAEPLNGKPEFFTPKTILSTDCLKPDGFIASPHGHLSCANKFADVHDIVLFHCWVNGRKRFTPELQEFHGLFNLFKTKSI